MVKRQNWGDSTRHIGKVIPANTLGSPNGERMNRKVAKKW